MLAGTAFLFSLVALAAAGLVLHRLRMVEFRPEVLAGDVILPRASRSRSPKLLLPLQFSNAGFADGVIEWIALRLTIDGNAERALLMTPVAEVDMAAFLQAKRQITPDNAIDPFGAFVLQGKRAL